jgi:hypothetical protein
MRQFPQLRMIRFLLYDIIDRGVLELGKAPSRQQQQAGEKSQFGSHWE